MRVRGSSPKTLKNQLFLRLSEATPPAAAPQKAFLALAFVNLSETRCLKKTSAHCLFGFSGEVAGLVRHVLGGGTLWTYHSGHNPSGCRNVGMKPGHTTGPMVVPILQNLLN
jgi:hypothetical protein